MFAVFSSGGKQHRVKEGEVIRVEKLPFDKGDQVVFDKVLLVARGDEVAVGTPYVKDGKILAEVVDEGRGPKIRVLKFKRRKDYMRRQGHRQAYTEVRITSIGGTGEE
tara:strand:- start:391 stop:714 length:324 start_codon:yes stop_codon:yes gene_type:complete